MFQRYLLHTAFQDKASQNPSCSRSSMWLNKAVLKISVVTYSYCAKSRFWILEVFSLMCVW